jgi:nucleoside-diphosphate kinase
MAIEQTLSIIKPDGVVRNLIGEVIKTFETNNLRIAAAKMIKMDTTMAGDFYSVHSDRPFYGDLIKYMTSGNVLVMVLEGENAVALNRKIMGATDPAEADPGTIRANFALSIEENVVHGSDSLENAAIELDFFFSATEIF